MRGYTTKDKFINWLFDDRTPFTKVLIVANVATFVPIALAQLAVILIYGAFATPLALAHPWTFFTYPLVGKYCCGAMSVLSLLFACLWLAGVGGSLERSWGTRTFAIFFFLVSGFSALGLLAGGFLSHSAPTAAGLWLPIAGVTVAFAMLNPEAQSLFMFVVPLKFKYLALISAAMVLVGYTGDGFAVGVLALAGCGFAYIYVNAGLQRGFAPRRTSRPDNVVRVHPRQSAASRLNPFHWIKERRDRRRLKDLFEKSGLED